MLFYLFYPPKCRCCSQFTASYRDLLCLACELEFATLDIQVDALSHISDLFYGRHHLICAQSITTYTKDGVVQRLIHALKYHGVQQVGAYFAKAYAKKITILHQKHHFDFIIPVPLHKQKLSERGYNQLTVFGKELSKILDVPFVEDTLIRSHYDTTQTKFGRLQRVNKSDNPFGLKQAAFLKDKHILLIDDVITTGSTLHYCLEVLQQITQKCSILTMAFTE
jgi:competence protein ComFC